jgi:hypothetical protein
MGEHPHDDRALRRLDEAELEVLRLRTLRDGDYDRYAQVLNHLVSRALPVVEQVCRRRGAELGLVLADIRLVIEDTWAQLLMRLRREEPLPPVAGIAADIAARTVERQIARPPSPPRLASRRPDLRIVPRNDSDSGNHRFNGNGRRPS